MKIGNDLRKKSKYDINDDLKLISKVKELFKDLDIENFTTDTKDKIIFVLGMPRSGTSLVEQIISSHSQVFGGGELPYMDILLKENFTNTEKDGIKNLLQIINNKNETKKIADKYLNYIKNLNNDNNFFLDKSLLNFL